MTVLVASSSPSDQITTLPQSLQYLISCLQNCRNVRPQQIKHYVLAARIQQEELFPWASFDHPVTDSYGRKQVYAGEFFQIMVMSWLPGDFSAIHDHGATEWGAVQCLGEALHLSYELQGSLLKTTEISLFGPDQVNAVDHDLIHQMGNPSSSPFLSLHVYGRPEGKGSVTRDERLFDLFEGAIQFTNGGVFFCLSEDQIARRELGLQADPETTLRHHQQMQTRINRVLQTPQLGLEQWQEKAVAVSAEIKHLLDLRSSSW